MFRLEETEDVYKCISDTIHGDYELMMKYHYDSPTTYEDAVTHSSKYVLLDVPNDAIFYAIYRNDVFYGYVVIQGSTIWDIAVKNVYRSELVLLWTFLFELIKSDVTIRLYERNHRDINLLITTKLAKPVEFDRYIKKNGYDMTFSDGNEKQIIYLPLSQILLNTI